ncbi:MAG: spore germination protein GerW family protein [Halobacteriaceae archaeon]
MDVSPLGDAVERLTERAGVDSVYGDAVERDGRTVVPVAKVAYGFGGGFGHGDDEGEGAGGGGGLAATPVGALEVGDDGTRFVRYDDGKGRLLLALLAGLLVGFLLGRSGDQRE